MTISRRGFLERSTKIGLGLALATLCDIPLVIKRALAENGLGRNGNKLLFIFLRGANDGLNSVIPAGDSAYAASRPNIRLPLDPGTDYAASGPCDLPRSAQPGDATFAYPNAIRLGNGFAALHPSLKFLAPVYNAGDLAIVHRVGYPRQSRSHFDSQRYWETGVPNSNLIKDGLFYRAMFESGLAGTAPLTGVSVQSSLPMSLRGSRAAMTNLTDPNRYNLLGIPNTAAGNAKADAYLQAALPFPFPEKKSRQLLNLQFQNLVNTLSIFASLDFTEGNGTTTGNYYRDQENTDGDTAPYYLFPTTQAKNGGYALHNNDASKYVVDAGAYSFFANLKAAAVILNKTDAIVAGTEMGGFDTHNNQGAATGAHANLQRRIGWALYALQKYFAGYADQAAWKNLVVVTLSEFGRTSVQNTSGGTDHAEASVMFVAGGAVNGYNKGVTRAGVFGCSPNDALPWVAGAAGSMFGVSGRYLKRSTDFRSVFGEIIRNHLGATPEQLQRIVPGYANEAQEHLRAGGTVVAPIESGTVSTPITGELGLV